MTSRYEQIAALRERVEELESALGPLAGLADAYPPSTPDNHPGIVSLNLSTLSIGDMRRAKRLLLKN